MSQTEAMNSDLISNSIATAAPSSSTSTQLAEKTSSTGSNDKEQPNTASVDSGPVQAYAKLEGEEYCYYIRTLQVTMGRQVARPHTVDIPLGNAKSVSRQHARLFYNFATQRFEIMVFGKNGAFINEQFVERGVTVPLENRTKIQIGESSFLFLLPRVGHPASTATSSARGGGDSAGYISTPQLEKSSTTSRLTDDDDPSVYATNKDVKPPYSYAHLIAQAINSTEDKRMALHEIYNYITTHFPYYQMAQNGWQNSIRHNLSLNKAFVKVPRSDAEPGKGAFWTIDPKADIQFLTGNVNKRTNKRSSSNKSSPADTASPGTELPQRKRAKKDTSDNDEDDSGVKMLQEQSPLSPSSSSSQPADRPTSTPIASTPSSSQPTVAKKSSSPVPSSSAPPTTSSNNSQQNIQAQIQIQLQATIRQHLLDPMRYPLPPSIAQLLPQAIAQLPPHLANQFSATLQTALRAHNNSSGVSSSSSEGAPPATNNSSSTSPAPPPPPQQQQPTSSSK